MINIFNQEESQSDLKVYVIVGGCLEIASFALSCAFSEPELPCKYDCNRYTVYMVYDLHGLWGFHDTSCYCDHISLS